MPTKVRRAVGYALSPAGREARRRQGAEGFWRCRRARGHRLAHGDTFRAVYTVRFGEVVYVLHVFQKKSKRGIATPRKELALIRKRLKLAEQDHNR